MRPMFKAPSARPISVSFYPDYTETNPYQRLLYDSVGPAIVARPEPLAALIERTAVHPEPSVFHLHWENAVTFLPGMSAERFLDDVVRFKDQGGRFVWTPHNLTPHEERHRAFSVEVRAGLLELADIVHLHSVPAVASVLTEWSLPLEKVRIIHHGNYDGVYPVFDRAEARAALGLEAARMCVLLPGRIGGYKAPDELSESFLEVAGPDDLLIVAGMSMRDATPLPDDPRIRVLPGFQDAETFSRCHAAADFVVLPYRSSLTSGSAALAATLGRGVLGADTPGLRDMVSPPATGVLYAANSPDTLRGALATAFSDGPDLWASRGKAAFEASRGRDWRVIGATWRALFSEVARGMTPRKLAETSPCG